jgi:hypothetical protein
LKINAKDIVDLCGLIVENQCQRISKMEKKIMQIVA